MSDARSETVAKAESYYDSKEADEFYKNFWGGEDIHIGLYTTLSDDVAKASHRTVVTMAEELGGLGRQSKVIDLGAGYGGSARYLCEPALWWVSRGTVRFPWSWYVSRGEIDL